MKIKAGDKVKLTYAKMLSGLNRDTVYTVAKTERSFVYLDILDTERGCWYESDFEKVEDNKHVHHELIIQHANDCTLKIEVKNSVGRWVVIRYPLWVNTKEYRIKPKPERQPFNLEEALAGKRVVTHEGYEVTQLVQFKTLSYPDNIYGVVKSVVGCWNEDGSYNTKSRVKSLYMQELS